MAGRTLPGNLGLTGDWALGENNWKDANDLNLIVLSVMSQGSVLSKVAAEPGAPVDGDIHILDETHATHPNAIAVRDEAAWLYIPPQTGMTLYNLDDDERYEFDGSEWVILAGFTTLAGLTDVDITGRADGDLLVWDTATSKYIHVAPSVPGAPTESIIIAIGDETTDIIIDAAAVKFRMPYAFTLTDVRASLSDASSAGDPEFDILEGGVSILSTTLTIDSGATTSVGATVPAVISDAALADDAEITLSILTAGADAKGAKIYLIGHQ